MHIFFYLKKMLILCSIVFKTSIVAQETNYFAAHPDIKKLIADYAQALLIGITNSLENPFCQGRFFKDKFRALSETCRCDWLHYSTLQEFCLASRIFRRERRLFRPLILHKHNNDSPVSFSTRCCILLRIADYTIFL